MLTNKFQTLVQLEELTRTLNRFQDGEKAYVEEEQKLYQYCEKDASWKEITGAELQYTLYELNKSIIHALPDATIEEIKNGIEEINLFFEETKAKNYMLLGKEISYYTILRHRKFHCEDETLGEATVACLNSIGIIKSIEKMDDKVEIWVLIDDDVFCLYLFSYDNGIVEFGRWEKMKTLVFNMNLGTFLNTAFIFHGDGTFDSYPIEGSENLAERIS